MLKKYIKKVLAMALSSTLIFSAFSVGTVVNAEDVATEMKFSYMNGYTSAAVGKPAAESTMKLVEGWSSGRTRYSTTEFVAGHCGYGAKNSIKINSDTAEGWKVSGGYPLNLQTGWYISLDGVEALMIYVELPANLPSNDWYIGLNGNFTAIDSSTNKYFYGKYQNAVYQYLEKEDANWSTATTDGNARFTAIKPGFSGYIKIYPENINTVTNGIWTQNDTSKALSELMLSYIGFDIAYIGGDYGAVYYGGQYAVCKDSDSIMAILPNQTQAGHLNFGRTVNKAYTSQWSDLVTDTVADITTYTINGNAAATMAKTKASDGIELYWQNWGTTPSQANMTYGDAKSAATKRSVVIDSPSVEGWAANPACHTWIYDKSRLLFKESNYADPSKGEDARYAMFYIETPSSDAKGYNGIRLSAQSWGTTISGADYPSVSFVGLPFYYLNSNDSDWVSAGAVAANGECKVPTGFKGYIVVDLKNILDNLSLLTLHSVEIRLGCFGGDYGSFVYGGMYALTDFNQAITLSAQRRYWNQTENAKWTDYFDKEYMTSNRIKDVINFGDVNKDWQVDIRDLVAMKKNLSATDYYYVDADLAFDNVIDAGDLSLMKKYLLGLIKDIGSLATANYSKVMQFEKTINQISVMDITQTDNLDTANFTYLSMSESENNLVSDSTVNKLKTFNEQSQQYRPEMLGFSLKPYLTETKSLKVGSKMPTANQNGIQIIGYGIVSIKEADYDYSAPLSINTVGAENSYIASGSNQNSEFSAAVVVKSIADYAAPIMTRSYVVYSDGTNQYTVYNRLYTYSDGTVDLCMTGTLLKTANVMNVSIYAKAPKVEMSI